MTRAHLLTAAAVLIACGCTESSVGPTNRSGGAIPEAPQPMVITGTVEVSPLGVALRLESGELINLVGSETNRIAPLSGAEVQVSGVWGEAGSPMIDSDVDPTAPGFAVHEFLVLAVGGRPALDGVVEKDEDRYYLRLATGDAFLLDEGPSGFEPYIGERIWVTGSVEDPPLAFGVI